MEKVLVCVNDGLLKIRLQRVLSDNNLSYDFTRNPIKSSDLFRYALIIIHSSYNLPNLYKFIENVIIKGEITIIYITTNTRSNQFIKFDKSPNLIIVDENKMDIEINLAINIYNKLYKDIKILRENNEYLKKTLENEKLMTKCKKILMKEGLDEDQAHKLILKYAMDNKINKEQACKRLISEKTQ